MLRGRYNVRVDEKGRIKLPAAFRSDLESTYDRTFFVTSMTGQSVKLYPMKFWMEKEEQFAAQPGMQPAMRRFLERANYHGQVVEMDGQGRLVIPPDLRKSAELSGEAIVLGCLKYMEIWLHEKFQAKLEAQPFTEAEEQAVAEFGM